MKRFIFKTVSIAVIFFHLFTVVLRDATLAAPAKGSSSAKSSGSSAKAAPKGPPENRSLKKPAATSDNLVLQNKITSSAGFNLAALQSFQSDPFTGKASFSLPISVPAGRKGIQPNIALTYSSGGPNGILGLGWGLNLGSIERSTKKGVPKYDSTDTFVFNSGSPMELVYIGGNNYRAKIEGAFMKFEFDGSSWVVTDKTGTKYYFGQTYDSRQESENKIFKWCLDKVEDINGNYLTITYIKEEKQLYPAKIDYTGNEKANDALPFASVVFDYTDPAQPDIRPDTFTSYRSGFKIVTLKRLYNIRVKFQDKLLRRYHLEYAASSDTGRSILRSVTQYGSDDKTTLPPLIFEYEEQKSGWQLSSQKLPGSQSFDWTTNLIDANNDGFIDIITDNGHATYLGQKDGSWIKSDKWEFPGGDYTNQHGDCGWRFADLDADGWIDVMQHVHSNTGGSHPAKVFINDKKGAWVYNPDLSGIFPCQAYFSFSHDKDVPWSWFEVIGYVLTDANADGLVDIIRARGDGHEFYLNTGSGWVRDVSYETHSDADFTNSSTQLGDINGDGLVDLVIARSDFKKAFINTGTKWEESDSYKLPADTDINFTDNSTQLIDINSDGLADIVIARGSLKKTYINKGTASDIWKQDNNFVLPEGDFTNHAVRLADSKGRCLLDILINKSSSENKIYSNNNTMPAGYLKRISNGIGGSLSITYKPSTEFDNTGEEDDISDLPFPVYAVDKVTLHDNVNPASPDVITRYEYKDGMFDFTDREFRGFGYVKVIDAEGNYTETRFHQDAIYKGRPYLQETKDASGKLYAKTENKWGHRGVAGANFVYLSSSDNYIYDGEDAPELIHKEFIRYDEYGNLEEATTTGAVYKDGGKTSQTQTQVTEYTYNTIDYIVALPGYTYLKTNGKERNDSESRFYYDNIGNLTKKDSWLKDEANNKDERIATQYAYDDYGNLISSTNAKGHTTTTIYDSRFHLYPVEVRNAKDHTAKTVYYGINEPAGDSITGYGLPGQAKCTQDANGQKTYNVYDALGRLIAVIGPKDTLKEPGTAYKYEQTANPVKITKAVKAVYSAEPNSDNDNQDSTEIPADTFMSFSLEEANRYYNGNADFTGFPDSDNWNFGSGDFTIDFWVKWNSLPGVGEYQYLFLQTSTDRTVAFVIENYEGAYRYMFHGQGSGANFYRPASVTVGTWYHLAVVRSGKIFRIYQDGIQSGDDAIGAISMPDSTGTFTIGCHPNTLGPLNAWIDGFRVTKGRALWVSDFTPSRGSDAVSLTEPVPGGAKTEGYLFVHQFLDGLGRALQIKTPVQGDPNTGTLRQVISGSVVYDARGKVREKYLPCFADKSGSYAPPSFDTPHAAFTYDALGRLTQTTNPDGSYSNLIYSGLNTASIDENGHKLVKYTDAFGRIARVEEYSGADGRSTQYPYQEYQLYSTTRYEYDTLGNLTKVIDEYNNTTEIKYDTFGRKVWMSDPDMGEWQYEYDSLGNLIRQTDAKGQVLHFKYDELNRLVEKRGLSPEGTVPFSPVTYIYDNKSNSIGRLSKVEYPGGSTEFFYDKLGREIKSVKKIDGQTRPFEVSRAYDAVDNLTALKYPDGETVIYTYDKDSGQLINVKGSRTYIENIIYTETGQIKTIKYGNGTETNYDYDPSTLRLTHLTTDSPGGTIQDLDYHFDSGGNISNIIDSVNTATQAFQYDHLGRLIRAEGAYGPFSYNYDSIGNMIYKEGVSLQYGKDGRLPHAVTKYGDTEIDYDANGNMVKKGDLLYDYDVENRLTEVKKAPFIQNWDEYSITLHPGWNFFSLPGIVSEGKVVELLASIKGKYDQVCRYDPIKKKFEHYVGNPKFNQFEQLAYGEGYQIYITSEEPVTFTPYCVKLNEHTITLKEGWNLVGSLPEKTLAQNNNFFTLQKGIDYDRILGYNKDTDKLISQDDGSLQINSTGAYYIRCLKNTPLKLDFNDPPTTFTYDGDGGRVKKTASLRGAAGEEAVSTIYIGSLFEKDSSGRSTRHIFAGANRVATVSLRGGEADEAISYFHSDHLGSSNVITNQRGEQVGYTEFTPFGTTFKQTGTYDPKHKFTGKELDASTGLYFYGARYYDPELGRFITPDTIVQSPYDPQSLNRYSYCRNNPINYVDPTGKLWWFIPAIIAALKAFVVAHPFIAAGIAGATFNTAFNASNIHNFGDFAAYAGMGAASAVAGAWAGGTIGGAFGTFWGVVGGTATAGFLGGAGNAGYRGKSFGDAMQSGLISGGIAAATAAVFYGIAKLGEKAVAKVEQQAAAQSETAGVKTSAVEQGKGTTTAALDIDVASTTVETQALLSGGAEKAVGSTGYYADYEGMNLFHLTIGRNEPLVQINAVNNSLKTLNARANLGKGLLFLKTEGAVKLFSNDAPTGGGFLSDLVGMTKLYSAGKTAVHINIINEEIKNTQRILSEHSLSK